MRPSASKPYRSFGLASTQRMKLRALGIQRERSGDSMKAWAKSFYLSAAWENTRAPPLIIFLNRGDYAPVCVKTIPQLWRSLMMLFIMAVLA